MIEIGMMNKVYVHKKMGGGYILRVTDLDIDIILPHAEARSELNIDDEIEVFVYVDKDDQTYASMSAPSALLNEFSVMQVKETHQFGAFADWGIKKDLLIPDTEQKEPVGPGKYYIVRVCIDERTNKLYGTTKIGKYIQAAKFDMAVGDAVKIIPAQKEELGYRSLINKKFVGMIYYNEIFQPIELGAEIDGVVKKLRADGLVDVALQVQGIKNIVNSQDKILAYLEQMGGKAPLHDKSSPAEIKAHLNMSKKTFKNSIGMLYKQRKIIIHKDGIELVSNETGKVR